jgi:hypothetical protein
MAKKKAPSKKLAEILFSGPKEIAPETVIEKINPMYFNSTVLKHQPETLYRLDAQNYRYYYRYENGEPVFYTSVTTMIKNSLPTSPHLIQWLIVKGGDNGKDEAMERASYGTFLHVQCGELLMSGTYDLDKLKEKLVPFLVAEGLPADRVKWEGELKKDVLAFAQFMIEKNIKPLAIEICLWHPTDGYAGALDIVAEMDIEEKGFFGEVYLSGVNKGQPKESKQIRRVIAIIDIKSGKKGFYESAEIQLAAYNEMWNIHFPETPIEKLFNWSPKEFRTTPSYNLKDQTDSKKARKLQHLVQISKLEDDGRENKVTIVSGMIDLVKGLEGNLSEKTFAELVKHDTL